MKLPRRSLVMEHPDPKNHLKWSLLKSSFRILAGAVLIGEYIVLAGLLLIVAEVLGIAEEVV
jgi:hypothetical protein